jgi:hypothetical protein
LSLHQERNHQKNGCQASKGNPEPQRNGFKQQPPIPIPHPISKERKTVYDAGCTMK